jgi:hypothetical protein
VGKIFIIGGSFAIKDVWVLRCDHCDIAKRARDLREYSNQGRSNEEYGCFQFMNEGYESIFRLRGLYSK